uniref:Uncharacterized protein n=1 Tax=Setaria digitata TaxID=48799 RepID=A0A915PJU6_9BILA
MSNSAAARPTSGGTGIRSFFSKLRKPSDLQIPPAQPTMLGLKLLEFVMLGQHGTPHNKQRENFGALCWRKVCPSESKVEEKRGFLY